MGAHDAYMRHWLVKSYGLHPPYRDGVSRSPIVQARLSPQQYTMLTNSMCSNSRVNKDSIKKALIVTKLYIQTLGVYAVLVIVYITKLL